MGAIPSIQSLDFLFNILLYVFWIAIFNVNLEKRFHPALVIAVEALCLVPYCWFASAFAHFSFLRMFAGLALVIVQVMVLYRNRLVHKLLVAGMVFAALFLTELLVPYTLLSTEQIQGGIFNLPLRMQAMLCIVYYAVYALLLLGVTLFWKKVMSKEDLALLRLPRLMWAVILVTVVSQYALMMVVFPLLANDANKSGPIVMIVALLLVLAEQEKQNELQRQLYSAREEYYATLSEQYQTIRRLRHDLDNHLFTMQILVENNELERAKEYLSEVKQSLGQKQDESHPTVSAFLEYRAKQLEKNGITLAYTHSIPRTAKITDVDLVTAIGNMLDNAAEACEQAADRTINIQAEHKNGYLVIRTENASVAPKTKKQKIADLARGQGTGILKSLAQKFDGEYTLQNTDGRTTAQLILKCGA